MKFKKQKRFVAEVKIMMFDPNCEYCDVDHAGLSNWISDEYKTKRLARKVAVAVAKEHDGGTILLHKITKVIRRDNG